MKALPAEVLSTGKALDRATLKTTGIREEKETRK
jgi:hypothetical protein